MTHTGQGEVSSVWLAIGRRKIEEEGNPAELASSSNMSLDELIERVARVEKARFELQKRGGRSTKPAPKGPQKKEAAQPAKATRNTRKLPVDIPEVLRAAEKPLLRSEIRFKLLELGWAETKTFHTTVDNAIAKLVRANQLEEVDGPKPKRIRLPEASAK